MSIYIPCHTAWHLLRNIWTKNLSTVKYWLNKLKYLMGITRFTSYFKNKINEYFVLKQEHKTICFRLTVMFWNFLYKMGMIQYCFTENILFFQSYKWVSTYYIIIQMLKPKNHPNAEAQSNLLPNNGKWKKMEKYFSFQFRISKFKSKSFPGKRTQTDCGLL